MNEAITAARCEINRLKGLRHFHGVAEERKAREIQAHIKAQVAIEDSIMEWELHIAKLLIKENSTPWLKVKGIFK